MSYKRLLNVFILLFSTFIFFSGCSKKDSSLPGINADNDKAVGASANDLLASGKFNSLRIELQYMKGFPPDLNSVNNLIEFLNSLINKTGGIIITQQEIASGGKPSYSVNDIASIEQKNRSTFNSAGQLSVYILIADSAFTDPTVYGIAYRNTSVCLFGKTIFDNSGNFLQVDRTKLETTIVEHEFSHLLGLVDTGSPMKTNHKDTAHGNHCNVQSCLMYFASETGFLATGDTPALDAQCRADLHANGGK